MPRRYSRVARPIPPDRFEEIDASIRRAWSENHYGHLAQNRAARLTGLTEAQCARRAAELGLVFTRERHRWTDAERDLVERHAHKSLEAIQRILVKSGLSPAGIKRTRSAIAIQIHAGRFRTNLDGMNQIDLADAFGVSVHQVEQWRIERMIRGRRLESQDLHQRVFKVGPRCGDPKPISFQNQHWFYQNKDIRQFIFGFPGAFDLRKVNQVWFIDLLRVGRTARIDAFLEKKTRVVHSGQL